MNRMHFLLTILGFMILLTGCNTDSDATNRDNCLSENLLLESTNYPPGTIINDINSPIDEKPKDSASRTANFNADAMGQIVIRFSSQDRAKEEYQAHQTSIFESNEVAGIWETPPILDLNNLSANPQEIACGNVVSFGKRCFMIGQYEEYFVLFSADISSNGVTHELFRDLVLNIDKEMSSCLDR